LAEEKKVQEIQDHAGKDDRLVNDEPHAFADRIQVDGAWGTGRNAAVLGDFANHHKCQQDNNE
jgi:hypothetical protein